MREYRIEIPCIPPKELSTNARVHWSVRHQHASQLRTTANYYALNCTHCSRPGLERAEVEVSFIIRNKKQIRDTDNALAALKAGIDGCVDAGIVKDDSPEYLTYKMPIKWEVDKQRAPLTVLTFREIE